MSDFDERAARILGTEEPAPEPTVEVSDFDMRAAKLLQQQKGPAPSPKEDLGDLKAPIGVDKLPPRPHYEDDNDTKARKVYAAHRYLKNTARGRKAVEGGAIGPVKTGVGLSGYNEFIASVKERGMDEENQKTLNLLASRSESAMGAVEKLRKADAERNKSLAEFEDVGDWRRYKSMWTLGLGGDGRANAAVGERLREIAAGGARLAGVPFEGLFGVSPTAAGTHVAQDLLGQKMSGFNEYDPVFDEVVEKMPAGAKEVFELTESVGRIWGMTVGIKPFALGYKSALQAIPGVTEKVAAKAAGAAALTTFSAGMGAIEGARGAEKFSDIDMKKVKEGAKRGGIAGAIFGTLTPAADKYVKSLFGSLKGALPEKVSNAAGFIAGTAAVNEAEGRPTTLKDVISSGLLAQFGLKPGTKVDGKAAPRRKAPAKTLGADATRARTNKADLGEIDMTGGSTKQRAAGTGVSEGKQREQEGLAFARKESGKYLDSFSTGKPGVSETVGRSSSGSDYTNVMTNKDREVVHRDRRGNADAVLSVDSRGVVDNFYSKTASGAMRLMQMVKKNGWKIDPGSHDTPFGTWLRARARGEKVGPPPREMVFGKFTETIGGAKGASIELTKPKPELMHGGIPLGGVGNAVDLLQGLFGRTRKNMADRALERSELKRQAESTIVATRLGKLRRGLSETDMEDIGGAIEGIGNLKTGKPVDAATFSPKKRAMHEFIKKRFESTRRQLNEFVKNASGGKEKEFLQFIDDYLPHFYVGKPEAIKKFARKWMKDSPNAKKRKFPTLKEAMDSGLVPRTQNAGELLQTYTDINWKVATTKDAIYSFAKGKMPDGRKAVETKRSDGNEDYVRMDNEILRRFRYGGKTKDGKGALLFEGGAWVHPEAAGAMKAMTDPGFGNSGMGAKFLNAVETYNAVAKQMQLKMSFFHDLSLFESAVGTLGWMKGSVRIGQIDPSTGKRMLVTTARRAGARLLERGTPEMSLEQIHRDAIEVGTLNLGIPSEVRESQLKPVWEAIGRGMDNLPGGWSVKKSGQFTGKALRAASKARTEMLWGYHKKLKLLSYYELVKKYAPKVAPEDLPKLKSIVGEFVNDAFGGQQWATQRYMRNKKFQKLVHAITFAPDWTISNIRVANPGFGEQYKLRTPEGKAIYPRARMHATYWRNMVMAQTIMGYAAQAAIYTAFGDDEKGDHMYPHQDEYGPINALFPNVDITPLSRAVEGSSALKLLLGAGYDPDKPKQRIKAHGGKQARELGRYVTSTGDILFNKSSPVVRQAWAQFTGSQSPFTDFKTDFGRNEDDTGGLDLPGRLQFAASDFIPFSLRGSQFALSIPAGKGMTPYKGRIAVSQAMREYAEPGIFSRLRGRPDATFNVEEIVGDILNAAKINGHDADKILREGVARARSHYYREFYNRIKDGEMPSGKDASARALVRLNTKLTGILSSMKARGLDISAKTRNEIWSVMKEAAEEENHRARTGIKPKGGR